MITTTNPKTGMCAATTLSEATSVEVNGRVEAASRSAARLEEIGRLGRGALLDDIAEALESRRRLLVSTAGEETGLDRSRLNGELNRAVFQLRLFADVLREGSYLEAMIDHAGNTPLGPAPDVRRMLVPVGPVAIFGASNFPFAFSVAGGDTASALAAGCPVILKGHESHPLTSAHSFEAIASAVAHNGLDEGTVSLLFGLDAGARLAAHQAIKAVTFTGSLRTGQLLLDIVNQRSDPIPFYGELSSLNPLLVSAAAATARTDAIATDLFASFTGSGGQLCTKPGIAFIPEGSEGDELVEKLAALTTKAPPSVLLNERIFESFAMISQRLLDGGAALAARGRASGDGFLGAPTLLSIPATQFTPELAEECFGPLLLLVRYTDISELTAVIEQLPPSLTASIHVEDEPDLSARLTRLVQGRVGRVVYNGYPTGVRVSWAQHHGGPWPSTNSHHTSVGATAIRRFLRPFVWQAAPHTDLPPELRDGPVSFPRRINGQLVLP